MSDLEIKIVQLEEKMRVVNGRVGDIGADTKALTGAVNDLRMSINGLDRTVKTIAEKEANRAKWFGWGAAIIGGSILTSVANFIVRGGFAP